MPILDSTITRNHVRMPGKRVVHEQHTDHNGEIHCHRYHCPESHDPSTTLAENAAKVEASLILSEKGTYQEAIQEGADPATLQTKHISASDKAKRVVKALMLGSPAKMLKAAEYVQGFTNAQIENHFTQAQRIRIRERQNYILNNQAVFDGDVREEM